MKEFIKNNIAGVIVWLILILSVLFAFKYYNRYKDLSDNLSSLEGFKMRITDSMKVVNLQEKEQALAKQGLEYLQALNRIQKKGVQYKTIYLDKVQANNIDTTSYSATCEEALKACDDYVTNLEAQNDTLYKVVDIQNEQISLFDSINDLNYKQLRNCEINEKALRNSLKATDTWWNRNKFKVGLGTGVVVSVAGMFGILKLIK
jgi:predicted negative regulator of RcsB-dependent stress response